MVDMAMSMSDTYMRPNHARTLLSYALVPPNKQI